MLLALLMLVGMVPIAAISSLAAAPADDKGLSFTAADQWTITNKLTAVPQTFAAWINVPKSLANNARGGEIFTNYDGGAEDFAFDLRSGGHPYIWYYNTEGKNVKVTFDEVNVRQDEWLHLVVVNDTENGVMKCYVNGELKQTVTEADAGCDFTYKGDAMLVSSYMIGDDSRALYPFAGKIGEFAAYTDALTDSQVSAMYANGVDSENESLLLHFDTTNVTGGYITDLTGNGFNATNATFRSEGMTFPQGSSDIMWKMPYALDTAPLTFETWINVPEDAGNGRLGNIISNYIGSGTDGIVLDIVTNGNPRVYFVNSAGKLINHTFTSVDVRRGEYIHLALVNDPEADTITCYVNGHAAEVLNAASTTYGVTDYNMDKVIKNAFSLGGDNRTHADGTSFNQYPFKGKMRGFAIYSGSLTATEIMASYSNGIDTTRTDIIASYDLKTQPTGYTIPLRKVRFFSTIELLKCVDQFDG